MIKALKFCSFLAIYLFVFTSNAETKLSYKEVKMNYSVSIVDPESHYLEVTLNLEDLHSKTTKLLLPVWTPGYYLILDTPRYIVDFEVLDHNGKKIIWKKETKNCWVIENGDKTKFTVKYRVFANKKSVAESYVDAEKAFLMPNTIFMHLENAIANPVTLTVNKYDKWSKISTGLKRAGEKENVFFANNFDVFYDSPIYIGNQKTIDFTHEGKSYSLGIATPKGLNEESFVGDLKKIMSATTAIMQKIPYDNYSYIMMEAGGGGLEHWNSQAIFTKGSFDSSSTIDYTNFLNFVTHEYFHLYNVKAIRPIELGPFDYNKENYTTMLWVSEGFTVYYEYIIMMKAGLLTGKDALKYLTNSIRSYENAEGSKHMSLAQSSFDIWLNFFNHESNAKQTIISYYDKGPTIGLLLDLEIRNNTSNQKSLDDVMRFLYNEFYMKKQRGFTEAEFWSVCEQYSGKPLDEIKKYVNTVEEIDYQKYLKYGGLQIDLSPVTPGNIKNKVIEKDFTITALPDATKLQLEIRKSIFEF
ncbi:peptidase M61 [Flavobacterium sp. GA093]|uniref:Peptidase M61 n=1 Tax=Flavobacterium hydrocarbonoxydans TaxID=2683249 RepID=A0A6I4NJG7_9FLAO|nr:M61 family metallopeptidase [Flavobacterium hydrocarbonoxydans]MWB94123.1 peptidase M61 [Flavobacterium hydrocarbonoxydans]